MNKENLFYLVLLLGFAFLIGVITSVSEVYKKSKEQDLAEKRQSMTKQERIIFDASLERCSKVSGSTPSCWTEADWDLFFLKYCQRIKCD